MLIGPAGRTKSAKFHDYPRLWWSFLWGLLWLGLLLLGLWVETLSGCSNIHLSWVDSLHSQIFEALAVFFSTATLLTTILHLCLFSVLGGPSVLVSSVLSMRVCICIQCWSMVAWYVFADIQEPLYIVVAATLCLGWTMVKSPYEYDFWSTNSTRWWPSIVSWFISPIDSKT